MVNIRRALTNVVGNGDDLKIWNAGAKSSSRYGPVIRDHYYILHLVQGCGVLETGGRTFQLETGQGFVVPPETVHRYAAEGEKPWSYFWFSFHGLKADHIIRQAGLSYEQPVYAIEDKHDIFHTLKKLVDQKLLHNQKPCSEITRMKVLSLFYLYFSELMEAASGAVMDLPTELQSERYIKKALAYIELNFFRKIKMTDLASYVGLNASYLGQLFKRHLHVTPQQYLCRFRIEKAIQYMLNPAISLKEISSSVGYEDPYLFSRIFKQIKSVSPSEYRKTLMGQFNEL
ncbi:helix-turn-helix transcriptional regulator [Paenibacillus sp. UNC451MF]|uniref:helix-turn-helix transcriptional regulator n=1 Tax=Paenibacillus sp. UNC451MF TaxID=1449063 RepID=UPI00068B4257|nr:AraC family transcriptional regulator [Paenibacillus sp. UNC451MF]